MFNTNLSLTVPSLMIMDGGTPRTPEILNSLMAMTNPLEYSYPVNNSQTSLNDSHSNSSDSPLDSPASQHQPHLSQPQQHLLHTGKTPSVQQTCSQLIKEGVKLLIQSKRKHSGGDSSDGNESSSTPKAKVARRREVSLTDHQDTSEDDIDSKASPRSTVALTPEDEDRRRRRRERNKIAATKCRMKKRERTVNLINESETLDAQNKELKSQVSKLETECRKLLEVLQAHGPTCVHQKGYQPLPSLSTILGGNSGGKYLNDLNYLESNASTGGQSAGEVKYSECLKSTGGSSTGSPAALLPPGYCKLSPTEPTAFGLLESSPDLAVESMPKADYIPVMSSAASSPVSQPTKRTKPGPKPRQPRQSQQKASATPVTSSLPSMVSNGNGGNGGFSTSKGNPLIVATLMTSTPSSSPSSVPSPLTVSNSVPSMSGMNSMVALGTTDEDDFMLKSELIDTHSPYTTVQSADRFLFDASLDLYNNNSPLNAALNCGTSHHQQQQQQQQQHHQHNHHLQQQQQQQQHNTNLNNNNNNPSLVNENDKLNHLNAIKENTSNTLLEFSASFETLKPATVDYSQQQQQHSSGMHHQQQQLDSMLVGDPNMGHLLHHQSPQQNHAQHHHQHQQQQQQHHQQQHHLQQQQHQHQLQHHLQQQHQLQQQHLDMLVPVSNDFLLLADDDPTGFTDLDSGITAYSSINGCLA